MKPKTLPGLQGYQLLVTKVRPDGTQRLTTVKLPKDVNPDIGKKLPKPKDG